MKVSRDRIFYLDFIRVVATLMIIVFHYLAGVESYELLQNPDAFKIGGISLLNLGGVNLTLGNYAVSLFFIISGASLMHVYQNNFDIKLFYKKRAYAIYPLYYIAFFTASFIQILVNHKLNYGAPLWTLLLTVVGMDGWLAEVVSTYALVGDWFIGCIICIYIFFPLMRKCMNSHPNITLGIYAIIFLVWEYIYPFEFSKRSSIILRAFEVLLGMYYIKTGKKASLKSFLMSLLLLGIIFIVKIPIISLYILVPIAGMSLFIVLNYLAGWIKSEKVKNAIFVMSYNSFATFLMHHFILYMIMETLPEKILGIGSMAGLLVICMAVVWGVGVIIKKIEMFIKQ